MGIKKIFGDVMYGKTPVEEVYNLELHKILYMFNIKGDVTGTFFDKNNGILKVTVKK